MVNRRCPQLPWMNLALLSFSESLTISDDKGVQYTTPQWVSQASDLCSNTNNYPVAYAAGSKIKLAQVLFLGDEGMNDFQFSKIKAEMKIDGITIAKAETSTFYRGYNDNNTWNIDERTGVLFTSTKGFRIQ